jgi:hypothetical protein
LLPMRQRSVRHELNLPAWHKPYAEALLPTEPKTLSKLLTDVEIAFFERLLELTDADEREDISRAIDVVLNLKAAQASSKVPT